MSYENLFLLSERHFDQFDIWRPIDRSIDRCYWFKHVNIPHMLCCELNENVFNVPV